LAKSGSFRPDAIGQRRFHAGEGRIALVAAHLDDAGRTLRLRLREDFERGVARGVHRGIRSELRDHEVAVQPPVGAGHEPLQFGERRRDRGRGRNRRRRGCGGRGIPAGLGIDRVHAGLPRNDRLDCRRGGNRRRAQRIRRRAKAVHQRGGTGRQRVRGRRRRSGQDQSREALLNGFIGGHPCFSIHQRADFLGTHAGARGIDRRHRAIDALQHLDRIG
jgi:hypothetical protein